MTWLEWIFSFILAWLCLDVFIIIMIWGFTNIVKSRFPDWWRRIIADRDPYDY
jgi:hypothetical protein